MMTTQMELLQSLDLINLTDNLKLAATRLNEGKMILLLDAFERENEGDLVVAAEKITTESMNFLIKKGSGVVCLALPRARLDFLGLPPMIPDNTNFFNTAFTVSIEAKSGVTTGVSAKDRAHTISVAMADDACSTDLARPGHVFPLAAQKNGVFDRMGHTEGSVDIMRIAGLKPGAVLCELMNDDGSMTIGQSRVDFARKFDIPVVSIEEILFHRIRCEAICERISQKMTNTRFGDITMHSFRFFDKTTIDIFHKASWDKSMQKARVAVVDGENLPKRFMAQMLEQTEDDPLFDALSKMSQDKIDCAVMTTVDAHAMKSQSETEAKTAAMVCRALCDLSIKTLVFDGTHQEPARIARDYFSLTVL
jgi:3,4-dihydroxy 2-butanone 4-phosphate synthase